MSPANPDRRNRRARAAILEAALGLCAEQGFDNMTMEGIARRGGVGKQTIYRWWPSRAAVLQEALSEQIGGVTDFPDTGDVRADLQAQLAEVVKLFTECRFEPYFRGLVAAAQSDPRTAEALVAGIVEPRVRAGVERLERAVAQGQIRADADLPEVVELLYAPLYYRMLLHTRPVSAQQPERILDLVFTGLAPEPSA